MSSDYLVILDGLLQEKMKKQDKKKREPSKFERQQFGEAWLKLAEVEGYSKNAEHYLYNCASYCGAEPLKRYLDICDDPKAVIEAYLTGHLFSTANADITFRLLANLLAHLLNDNKTWSLLPLIIKVFPGTCINKENKRLGTAEQTMTKYFFAELSPKIQFPQFESLRIDTAHLVEFISLMEDIIGNIKTEGLAKTKTENIGKVKQWLSTYEGSIQQDSKECVPEVDEQKAVVDDYVMPEAELETPPSALSESTPDEGTADDGEFSAAIDVVALVAEYEQVKQQLAAAIEGLAASQKQIDRLNDEMRMLRGKVATGEENLKNQLRICSEKDGEIARLSKACMEAETLIARQETLLAEREAEIIERRKLEDILRRDRSKQADEAFRKIASELKYEYQDFVSAIGEPMSCDLGENLRFQLQSIFEILEKAGIKFK